MHTKSNHVLLTSNPIHLQVQEKKESKRRVGGLTPSVRPLQPPHLALLSYSTVVDVNFITSINVIPLQQVWKLKKGNVAMTFHFFEALL